MGLVVEGVVARARARFGCVRASAWPEFTDQLRLNVYIVPLPDCFDAVIRDQTILVRQGMTGAASAYAVWHEVGHVMLHVGDWRWWIARPQGYLTVARFERQADEFARLFPVWDDAEMWGGVWG